MHSVRNPLGDQPCDVDEVSGRYVLRVSNAAVNNIPVVEAESALKKLCRIFDKAFGFPVPSEPRLCEAHVEIDLDGPATPRAMRSFRHLIGAETALDRMRAVDDWNTFVHGTPHVIHTHKHGTQPLNLG